MTDPTRLPIACTLSGPDLAKRVVTPQSRGHMRSRFFASNSSLLMSPRA
jgi:hypothetical protein